jgi:uncharacterized protein YjiS (DUF1127 family)
MHVPSDKHALMATVDGRTQPTPREWRSSRWTTAAAFAAKLAAWPTSQIRIWARRHRERQELLDLLATDHRTAADLGATEAELKSWANKPFWRP